jgi:L-alanine-DL-glutamate epimerase-like enolase superfamily enzyme
MATIAFAAAFAGTAGQAAELTNFVDLEADLLVNPPEVRDGRVAVSREPGIGVTVDESQLSRYRIDR